MEVPYREGVATHPGPEPCGGDREGAAEALAGVRTGRLLSSEINFLACRPCCFKGKTT
jgi:hypothetical protein